MSQNNNRNDDYLKQLFFDLTYSDIPATSILENLRNNTNFVEQKSSYTESLANVFQGKSRNTKLTHYYFKFTNAPVPNLNFDFGVIRVTVHESAGNTILDNIGWGIYCSDSTKANHSFDYLYQLFLSVSSHHSREKEGEIGEYMSFLLSQPSELGFKNISFGLLKSTTSDYYEIVFVPASELRER